MDGTLTVPCLDYADMRSQIFDIALRDESYSGELRQDLDILQMISQMSTGYRERAEHALKEIEMEGNKKMVIMPGLDVLLKFLDTQRFRRAVVTRNHWESVEALHARIEAPPFELALTRDFQPYKPDPAPLLHICNQWNVKPDEVLMVGDSVRHDVVCGRRAGTLTCLLKYDHPLAVTSAPLEAVSSEQVPHFSVQTLLELIPILSSCDKLQK